MPRRLVAESLAKVEGSAKAGMGLKLRTRNQELDPRNESAADETAGRWVADAGHDSNAATGTPAENTAVARRRAGADPNRQAFNSVPPLHFAAGLRNDDAVTALIKYGADRLYVCAGGTGQTPAASRTAVAGDCR
ncbi:MAG: hypothetical protein Q7S40_20990 [Opitutaceae bacterium]|nr:hypothetical protein [Opitutaceae bacterium]